MSADLARAALAYAKLGWRVHPCHWITNGTCSCGEPECGSAGKHPILTGWPERATTDPTMIDRWWGRSPQANIAVATGAASGILVLDVDGPEGEQSLANLERKHAPLPELYPMQWTGGGRGGWQAFFPYPEGPSIGNSAGRLGPKLDTRGDRGFVLLPPSRTAQYYRWETDRSPLALPLEPAPDWLVELLDRPEPQRQPYSHNGQYSDDRYVLKALESELALVASAPKGRRNEQLNESAFNLFRFVIEDRLAPAPIVNSLTGAARHAGLTDGEIRSTIRSAATARGVSL
jgi:Bifunctional DNA primase/polymerase, N-terminal